MLLLLIAGKSTKMLRIIKRNAGINEEYSEITAVYFKKWLSAIIATFFFENYSVLKEFLDKVCARIICEQTKNCSRKKNAKFAKFVCHFWKLAKFASKHGCDGCLIKSGYSDDGVRCTIRQALVFSPDTRWVYLEQGTNKGPGYPHNPPLPSRPEAYIKMEIYETTHIQIQLR